MCPDRLRRMFDSGRLNRVGGVLKSLRGKTLSPIISARFTAFEGGPGKTWSHGDFQITLDTLQRVILVWTDDTRCHPGHGGPFRLGDTRSAIESFISRDHGRFCGDATWGM